MHQFTAAAGEEVGLCPEMLLYCSVSLMLGHLRSPIPFLVGRKEDILGDTSVLSHCFFLL